MSYMTAAASHIGSLPSFNTSYPEPLGTPLHQHQTYPSDLHPAFASEHLMMADLMPPSETLQTQTPGAGPSRTTSTTRTRPLRASRPTSFKTYLTLEGDEDYPQSPTSYHSELDTDGDGDEYKAPSDGEGGYQGGGASEDEEFERAAQLDNDDFTSTNHNMMTGVEADVDENDPSHPTYDLFHAPDGTPRTPTAAQLKAFRRKLNRPDFHPDGTPIKRRPASTRKHIVIHGAVDPADLRTVDIAGTSVATSAGGNGVRGETPATPGKAGTRSREGSRSLPPSRTEKRFKCTWEGCGKAYTKPARLREHELSHTGERPHVCPYCSQSYIRPTHLTAHLRTHMSEDAKRYVCSVEGCGKRFWTGTHARRHEELHLEPMMYICEHCPEKFHKANQLRDHIALEHMPAGTKGYPCTHPGCTSSFTVKQHLKAHEKTHDPSRYTCAHPTHPTPLNFPNWTALQSHLSSAHPPTCPVEGCGKVFKHAYRLKEHMKVHDPVALGGDEDGGVNTQSGAGRKRKRPVAGDGADGDADAAHGASGAGEVGTATAAGAGAGKAKKKKGRPSKATRMANAAAAAAAEADHDHGPNEPASAVGYAMPGMPFPHAPHALADPQTMYSAYASPLAEQIYGDAPAPDAPGVYGGMYGEHATDFAGMQTVTSTFAEVPDLGGVDMMHAGTTELPLDLSPDSASDPAHIDPIFAAYTNDYHPYMAQPTPELDTYPTTTTTTTNNQPIHPAAHSDPFTHNSHPASATLHLLPDLTSPQPSSIRALGGGNIRHLACPVHMLTPSAAALDVANEAGATGDGDSATASAHLPGARPTTCFARFDKAYNVKRHLLADHGVELDLDVINDLLGLSA